MSRFAFFDQFGWLKFAKFVNTANYGKLSERKIETERSVAWNGKEEEALGGCFPTKKPE